MAQQLKKVRGRTLTQAYEAMRAKYGDEAVVIGTHTVTEGGVLGIFGRRVIELTVSVPRNELAPPRKPSPAEKKYASNSTLARKPEVNETVQYFEQIVRDAQQRMRGQAAPPAPGPRPKKPRTATVPAASKPRPAAAAKTEAKPSPSPVLPFPKRDTETPAGTDDLRRDLQEMREMLQVIYAESPGAGLPAEFAPHYRALLDRGVSRKVAAGLIAAVLRDADPEVLHDPHVFTERLGAEIRKIVPVTGGLTLRPGSRRVAALCGATGVGKTTNLAKLAAKYNINHLANVGLLTTDTYRVAAAEQLRVYANIIGLPLHVANDGKEMRQALDAFRPCDLVLMDTAGGSQFNFEQINELKGLLQMAQPDEVLLVLSACTPLEDLRNVVANFNCLKPTALLFTKLDETRQYGAMLSILVESGLPVSYLSVGQNVPDDIRAATPAMLANLILGGNDDRS